MPPHEISTTHTDERFSAKMAISKEHHSLHLFQEAAKRVRLPDSRWAFLGNQRLRNAPRRNPDPVAWREWWGMDLPDRPLPKDANSRLHAIGPWMEFFGAAETLLLDSNGKDSCLQHDLNLPLDAKYYGRYHVVTNFGTTEHVWPTQQQCFRTMHDLCKPGGLIAHAVPSVGCQKHGHWLYSLDWMKRVADAQFYETVCLTTRTSGGSGSSNGTDADQNPTPADQGLARTGRLHLSDAARPLRKSIQQRCIIPPLAPGQSVPGHRTRAPREHPQGPAGVGDARSHHVLVSRRTQGPMPRGRADRDDGGPGMIERTCLRCSKAFQADGRFNRICEPCRKKNHRLSGVKSADKQKFRKGSGNAARSE